MSGQTILTSLRTILQGISEMEDSAVVQWGSPLHVSSNFRRRFEIRCFQPNAEVITAGPSYLELVDWEVHIKAQIKERTDAGLPKNSYVQAQLQAVKDELNKYVSLNASSGVIFSHCSGWTPAQQNPQTSLWESVIVLRVQEAVSVTSSE